MPGKKSLTRKKPLRYMNEQLHYCPQCHLLHINCECSLTFIASAEVNPKTFNVKYLNKKLVTTKYFCSNCGEDITESVVLLPQNIIRSCWKYLQKPFSIEINKNKLWHVDYVIKKIEQTLFEQYL